MRHITEQTDPVVTNSLTTAVNPHLQTTNKIIWLPRQPPQ